MNIHELDSYNLGDAVRFHRRLNPRIWGRDEHLLPEVRERLLAIAADFQEFLGVEDLNVEDITISGSNAAYSYTKNSDIDLHLVVTMPDNPVYQELFNAKKYQYNDEHNIRIGGADVELYVQPADQAHHSQGIYSVRDSEWRQIPQRKRAQVDDACVRDKVADLDARIHAAIKSRNLESISTLWDKIKAMRKSGLEQHGEFGCENIAFKMLRNKGCIGALKDAMMAQKDRELSLREAPAQPFRYGYGTEVDEASLADMRAAFATDTKPQKQEVFRSPYEYEKVKKQREAEREEKIKQIARTPVKPWPSGVAEGHQGQPYSSEDGVAASTKMFCEDNDDTLVHDFIQHTATELGIDPMPEIHLHTDPEWSTSNHSFGRYDPDTHTLNVSMPNRHILDVLRTVAHELVHCSQHQQHHDMPPDAGETGSRWENDANARAGIIMRDWANTHPEHFELPPLEENASGYIPKNRKEAKLPQYAMALSVDIKPGEVGRQANKLALHTGRNGEPGLLMKTVNLRESNQLTLKDFVVAVSPHALEQCYNRGIDADQVDDILRNISSAKNSIMGQPAGAAFILHNGQGTALGMRKLKGKQLTLATVYRTGRDFVKGKYPTFQIASGTKDVDEDISRRNFVRGLGAAAGMAATGAGAKQLRDYEPKQVANITQIVDAPDAFAPDTQQLLHDKYVYNRLTKDAFLQMRADPDFASMVEYEQVFSQPMNSKVTLMFNNKNDKGYWVTPAVFDAISKEMAADQLLARNKRPGGVPMAKDPMATDKLPNTMRQSAPPTPGAEQDRVYRGIGANRATESVQESADDYHIRNTEKLDQVLARCCAMIERGQRQNPDRYGMVAACVIDPENRHVYGINLPGPDGTRRHAERVAIDKYRKQHGDVPPGSIVVTTCSPCNAPMDERAGESCKDLLNSAGIHKVYCGYIDPTQHDDEDADFAVGLTQNDELWEACKAFADTFLHEDELEEGWRNALAGAAAAATMAFTPAPANSTAAPTIDPSAQPAAVQQTPGAAAESALSRAAQAAGIKGVELAQFLAQCAHETGDFAHLEELGGNRYLAKYDPSVNPAKAKALGNTEAGDGARYKGRGFIQITGKANYANAGQALGIDLVNNPELAAKPDVAAKIAVWYWQNRVAPYVQDFSDTRGVTKRINPGLQGLQDRVDNFKDYQQQVASVAQPKAVA